MELAIGWIAPWVESERDSKTEWFFCFEATDHAYFFMLGGFLFSMDLEPTEFTLQTYLMF
jgi:hypothetical protein